MNSPSFEEMARDYGYDPNDFDSSGFDDFGLEQPQQMDYTYANHDNVGPYSYSDDIENSSPCPSRRIAASNMSYKQQSEPSYRDNVDDYDEDTAFVYSHNNYSQRSSQAGNLDPSRSTPFASRTSHPRSTQPVRRIYRGFGQTKYESQISNSTYDDTRNTASQISQHRQPRDGPDNSRGGIRLRLVSDLPDMYRALFKFGVFNAVQSECYDEVMHGDDNMVISAPTGSGKTVLFELAIIRMLSGTWNGHPKCIYVAPTKALCSEKFRDWQLKFQPLGVKCCELTGDTVHFGKSAWGDARDASIIVTTAEKWDSLTRNWSEHGKILSQIQLFLVDEIHILNETRGSTLEVVVSRMKARGSSIRFIFVSATVPNIEDVAKWVGRGPNGGPAVVKEFGEEFRPCKLTRHVYGFPRKQEQNDFQFNRILDFRLYGVLQQHSVNKPILVFCATRKGVMTTAEQLLKEYENATEKKKTLPWARPRKFSFSFHDKRLDKLAVCGLGVHHAGMTMDDRRLTEELYLNGSLRVIVATSTLAVGINLPAHTVIIKGVKMFINNMSQEYSDLDIVQMMGRAGRPQFDTEGVAIILCEAPLEAKYKALAQGQTILESCLHRNLSEHINSEIGLGTITDVESAKEWLHNSFLFQRIQKNPRHYAIGKQQNQTWQEKIDDLVTDSIKKLQENQMVAKNHKNDTTLNSTPYGDLMSKYYIRQNTMIALLNLPEKATLRQMLEGISTAEEFSEIKIRSGEKLIYGKLRDHNDIRFKLKKIEKTSDKVFLNIQAVLGGINLNDSEYKNGDNQPQLESLTIFRHIPRIAKALVEVAIERQFGAQVKHGLELLRCLTAKSWEDRPTVLRQIESIGEKSIKVLAQSGITNIATLRRQDTLRLELLLNRRAPFGNEILASVQQFPEYFLEVTELEVATDEGKGPVEVELSIKCGLLNEDTAGEKAKKSKNKGRDYTVVLTVNSDLDFIDFRRIPTRGLKGSRSFKIIAELTKPSQSIIVMISSETVAGVAMTETYRPNVPQHLYPTLDTRPRTSIERDLEGLEDDPDFWNMSIDSDEDEKMKDDEDKDIVIKDLTGPRGAKITGTSQAKTPAISPKKMSNGNYLCNHTCKDKTKCRHFCCRDGLAKKPPPPKRHATDASNDGPLVAKSTQHDAKAKLFKKEPVFHRIPENFTRIASKRKAKTVRKQDDGLQHLEDLHASTQVRENLKLSEGKQIRLDDLKLTSASTSEERKRKAEANFDVNFMDTEDIRPSPLLEAPELSDSDDLPEPADILRTSAATGKREKKTPTETDYSDSDFDSLIRAVKLPAGRPRSPKPGSSVIDLSSPPPKRKRSREPSDISLPESKHTKYGDPLSRSWNVRSNCSGPKAKEASPTQELFLSDPYSGDGSRYASPERTNNEDFVLDESLFDIVPAKPTSSPPSHLLESVFDTKNEVESQISLPTAPSNAQTVHKRTPSPEFEDPLAAQMAEFEDWLYNSGSVVIVDKLKD